MRQLKVALAMAATAILLTACGGGGGGGSPGGGITTPPPPTPPTPPPPPPPPPPAPARNSAMDALTVTETFAGFAAGSRVTYAPTQLAATTTSSGSSLQVTYDAATGGYTLVAGARSQTFLPANILIRQTAELTYFKNTSAGQDNFFLRLGHMPTSPGTPVYRYVRLGIWQRIDGGTVDQDVVAFGVPSLSTAVPKTGQAIYLTNVYAHVSKPGMSRKAILGSGVLDIDFGLGVFRTTSSIIDADIAGGMITSGDGLTLTGSGQIDSSGGLSGAIAYSNPLDRSASGTLQGGFFGPTAEEVGLSFTASGPGGAVMTGAMVGQRDVTLPSASPSLTNVTVSTAMNSTLGGFGASVDSAGTPPFRASIAYTVAGGGQVTVRPDGSVTVRPAWGASAAEVATVTAADLSATQRPNFTAYDTVANGRAVHVDLFKPGPSNSALAMTYASFGSWTRPLDYSGTWTNWVKYFFTYGLETDRNLLSQRTGTARYDGVVEGATMNADTVFKTVGGTSRFDVNFSGGTYSGALVLDAAPASGGALVALGTWDFAGALAAGRMDIAPLTQNGVLPVSGLDKNHIRPVFYGPDGQEIGAVFTVNSSWQGSIGSVGIAGATVAKRH